MAIHFHESPSLHPTIYSIFLVYDLFQKTARLIARISESQKSVSQKRPFPLDHFIHPLDILGHILHILAPLDPPVRVYPF